MLRWVSNAAQITPPTAKIPAAYQNAVV